MVKYRNVKMVVFWDVMLYSFVDRILQHNGNYLPNYKVHIPLDHNLDMHCGEDFKFDIYIYIYKTIL